MRIILRCEAPSAATRETNNTGQPELDGERIDNFGGRNIGNAARENRFVAGDAIEGRPILARFDGPAIVIGHAGAELEDAGFVVRVFPRFCEIGQVVNRGTLLNQRIEDVKADDAVEEEQLAHVRIEEVLS